MIGRSRLLLALVAPTVRRVPWGTVTGCVVVAVATVWFVASRETATTSLVVATLRWAAVVLAAAVASVLDDPTEDDLAGVALPLWCRRLVGLLVVVIVAAAGWALAMILPDLVLPWAAVSLEAAALVSLGVAAASMRGSRRASAPAGVVAVILPVALLLLAPLLPARWALVMEPTDTLAWRDVHQRWAFLAVGAAITVAVTARDPARRSAWRLVRPAHARVSSTVSATATSPEPLTETS